MQKQPANYIHAASVNHLEDKHQTITSFVGGWVGGGEPYFLGESDHNTSTNEFAEWGWSYSFKEYMQWVASFPGSPCAHGNEATQWGLSGSPSAERSLPGPPDLCLPLEANNSSLTMSITWTGGMREGRERWRKKEEKKAERERRGGSGRRRWGGGGGGGERRRREGREEGKEKRGRREKRRGGGRGRRGGRRRRRGGRGRKRGGGREERGRRRGGRGRGRGGIRLKHCSDTPDNPFTLYFSAITGGTPVINVGLILRITIATLNQGCYGNTVMKLSSWQTSIATQVKGVSPNREYMMKELLGMCIHVSAQAMAGIWKLIPVMTGDVTSQNTLPTKQQTQ